MEGSDDLLSGQKQDPPTLDEQEAAGGAARGANAKRAVIGEGGEPAVEQAPRTVRRGRRPRSAGAVDVIGAIRLALEGADNEKTAIAVIRKLVEYAPPTSNSVEPVQLFIKAIREAGGRIFVP